MDCEKFFSHRVLAHLVACSSTTKSFLFLKHHVLFTSSKRPSARLHLRFARCRTYCLTVFAFVSLTDCVRMLLVDADAFLISRSGVRLLAPAIARFHDFTIWPLHPAVH
eukprot:3461556-Pleurochrysis_carterae.AAC.1